MEVSGPNRLIGTAPPERSKAGAQLQRGKSLRKSHADVIFGAGCALSFRQSCSHSMFKSTPEICVLFLLRNGLSPYLLMIPSGIARWMWPGTCIAVIVPVAEQLAAPFYATVQTRSLPRGNVMSPSVMRVPSGLSAIRHHPERSGWQAAVLPLARQ